MEVVFWGVRGSFPAPGPETNRYGGNTSCVELRTKSGRLIILDAGTGMSPLGKALMESGEGQGGLHATLLLSHAHWDHIQGFPFFAPLYVRGNDLVIFGPSRSSARLESVLEGQMNPHFSPIHSLKNLGSHITIHAVSEEDSLEIDGITISVCLNPHGKTKALAYRFEEDGKVFVYAPDAGYPAAGVPERSLKLYRGAHVLVHDSTYTPEDRALRIERGFSSFVDAAEAALRSGAHHLVLFHYDQDYSDEMVDTMLGRCRDYLDARGGREIRLSAAFEGLRLAV